MRFSRWTEDGTIQQIFENLQKQIITDVKGKFYVWVALPSMCIIMLAEQKN